MVSTFLTCAFGVKPCDSVVLLNAANTENQTQTSLYTQGVTDCNAKSTANLVKFCLKGLRATFDAITTLGPKLKDYINCVNPPTPVCETYDLNARSEEKMSALKDDSRINAFYNELNACPTKSTTALVAQCRDDVLN